MVVKVLIELDTDKEPESFLEFCQWIEFGSVRVKSFKVVR